MHCQIFESFKKIEDELVVEHIRDCTDFNRQRYSGGTHYHLDDGEHFATILDNGECYSKYKFVKVDM